MHDHDLDLVAAHADGTLPDAQSSEVATWVASCPECAAEYATQLAVVELLRSASSPQMSAAERARLHAGVDSALDSVVITPTISSWQRRILGGVGAVAATLVVVVGIASVLPQLTGGDDSGGFEAASDTTTTAAADSAPALESSPAADEDMGIASDDAAEAEDAEGSDGGAVDGDTMMTQSPQAFVDAGVDYVGPAEAGALSMIAEDRVAQRLQYEDVRRAIPCVDQVGGDFSDLFGATLEVGSDQIDVFVFVLSDGSVSAFATDDCSQVPLDG